MYTVFQMIIFRKLLFTVACQEKKKEKFKGIKRFIFKIKGGFTLEPLREVEPLERGGE